MKVVDIKEYKKYLKKIKKINESFSPLFDTMLQEEKNKQLKLKKDKLNYNN